MWLQVRCLLSTCALSARHKFLTDAVNVGLTEHEHPTISLKNEDKRNGSVVRVERKWQRQFLGSQQ